MQAVPRIKANLNCLVSNRSLALLSVTACSAAGSLVRMQAVPRPDVLEIAWSQIAALQECALRLPVLHPCLHLVVACGDWCSDCPCHQHALWQSEIPLQSLPDPSGNCAAYLTTAITLTTWHMMKFMSGPGT